MSKKIIGKFTLAGLEYTIYDDTTRCHQAERKWLIDNPRGIIMVATKSQTGKVLDKEVITDYIWDAILYIIIALVMEKRKLYEVNESIGYAHTLIQGIKTLRYDFKRDCGFVQVMNTKYEIKLNNAYGHQEGFLGRYDDRDLRIDVVNCNPNGDKHNDKFVISTIMHEIVHAVNYKMGYGEDKRNKESFVNTLSSFITEVYYSMKVLGTSYSKSLKEDLSGIDLIKGFE